MGGFFISKNRLIENPVDGKNVDVEMHANCSAARQTNFVHKFHENGVFAHDSVDNNFHGLRLDSLPLRFISDKIFYGTVNRAGNL